MEKVFSLPFCSDLIKKIRNRWAATFKTNYDRIFCSASPETVFLVFDQPKKLPRKSGSVKDSFPISSPTENVWRKYRLEPKLISIETKADQIQDKRIWLFIDWSDLFSFGNPDCVSKSNSSWWSRHFHLKKHIASKTGDFFVPICRLDELTLGGRANALKIHFTI